MLKEFSIIIFVTPLVSLGNGRSTDFNKMNTNPSKAGFSIPSEKYVKESLRSVEAMIPRVMNSFKNGFLKSR